MIENITMGLLVLSGVISFGVFFALGCAFGNVMEYRRNHARVWHR